MAKLKNLTGQFIFMRLLLVFLCCCLHVRNYGQAKDFKTLPQPAWKFKTSQPVYSSPVVSDEIIYVGGCDSTLYAIDIKTGLAKWKFLTKGEIRSTVALHQDKLFLLSGDGWIYCLDKTNGSTSWKFKTGGEKKYELFSFADYYQSSPVYYDGMIYFGSGDEHIYALNASTGKLVWKFKTGSIVHTTPAVQNKKIYVGSFDGTFYCIDAINGKLLWKFKTVGQTYFPKGEINGSAGTFGDRVFFGARDYNFYALDADKGYCHWNTRFQRGWAVTTPAFTDSVLFIGTSDDHLFMALDPRSGRVLWKTDLQYNIFGAPAFSETLVYTGTLMGKLFAMDTKTGHTQWSFDTDGYKAHHLDYFKQDDTYRDDVFTSIIKKNEDFLELYVKMGAIFSKPLVTDKYIIVTSLDGTVYCLEQ